MSIEMATGSEMMETSDCDNSELITDRETVSEPHDAIDDEDQLEITVIISKCCNSFMMAVLSRFPNSKWRVIPTIGV